MSLFFLMGNYYIVYHLLILIQSECDYVKLGSLNSSVCKIKGEKYNLYTFQMLIRNVQSSTATYPPSYLFTYLQLFLTAHRWISVANYRDAMEK